MEISVNTGGENREMILAEAMERINSAAGGEREWEKDRIYGSFKAECEVSESDIMPVFRALTAKYPELRIFATHSEEIREDDSSAQWWRSTTIKTVRRPDGTTELIIDSGTYWN